MVKTSPESRHLWAFLLPMTEATGLPAGNAGLHMQKGGVNMNPCKLQKDGKKLIFCAYIVKNGRRVYPKHSRCFAIWVDDPE